VERAREGGGPELGCEREMRTKTKGSGGHVLLHKMGDRERYW
jgi:hypothetical protein